MTNTNYYRVEYKDGYREEWCHDTTFCSLVEARDFARKSGGTRRIVKETHREVILRVKKSRSGRAS